MYVCIDERMDLWWRVSLQQIANSKCAEVDDHSDHLSPLTKDLFRKEVHSWPGKLTDGEGDELHLLQFRKTFHSWHDGWEQCCRQCRLAGPLESQKGFPKSLSLLEYQ